MRLLHILLLVLLVGCGPGIRYRPGEIPAPTTTNLNDIQAGHQLHTQMVAQNPILRDPVQEKRVTKILQKILDATPTTGHWTATLVDSPVFNAMTAPGNFIYVYRGLLQAVPDDELAAVLAHEIAHRLAQHELESSEETLGRAISVLATIAAGAAMASQQGARPNGMSRTSWTLPTNSDRDLLPFDTPRIRNERQTRSVCSCSPMPVSIQRPFHRSGREKRPSVAPEDRTS